MKGLLSATSNGEGSAQCRTAAAHGSAAYTITSGWTRTLERRKPAPEIQRIAIALPLAALAYVRASGSMDADTYADIASDPGGFPMPEVETGVRIFVPQYGSDLGFHVVEVLAEILVSLAYELPSTVCPGILLYACQPISFALPQDPGGKASERRSFDQYQ
ncbi:hypothetical protein [Cupriavidus gilardii]|uniref:hypothetical protein n=1 Tax=Cupriavidus gilardii TaxID=82541 RepID=UPI0012E8DAED|nr:hypothetical protein [Cupriavidus gilardii]